MPSSASKKKAQYIKYLIYGGEYNDDTWLGAPEGASRPTEEVIQSTYIKYM